MSLEAPRLAASQVRDRLDPAPVVSTSTVFRGKVWDVRSDTVALDGSGVEVVREYVAHTGAVAILALREDRGVPEVFLIQQYRHPIGTHDWEIPAGLLDVEGEDPLRAAQRELAEEADLVAAHWEELTSFTPSPGGLDEVITIFLATGLTDLPVGERHHRQDEEAGMPCGWVALPDLVAAVLAGQVRNSALMLACLVLAARG